MKKLQLLGSTLLCSTLLLTGCQSHEDKVKEEKKQEAKKKADKKKQQKIEKDYREHAKTFFEDMYTGAHMTTFKSDDPNNDSKDFERREEALKKDYKKYKDGMNKYPIKDKKNKQIHQFITDIYKIDKANQDYEGQLRDIKGLDKDVVKKLMFQEYFYYDMSMLMLGKKYEDLDFEDIFDKRIKDFIGTIITDGSNDPQNTLANFIVNQGEGREASKDQLKKLPEMSLNRYNNVVTDKSDETKSADRTNKVIDKINKRVDKDSKIAHVKGNINSHFYDALKAEDEMLDHQDELKERAKQVKEQTE
ncbi:hypothetical protein [Staphylococcus pettenkoferi]|uniref:EMYY motif lipoprotein n=1 Tax=Staphylococcus pettenkoferi TaxID=170573 RepID=A0ABT4BLS8_9STAP|nr:hypothetical protein [Staphylococcus pettenkoferi]MCY1564317.1 hypothetical protein [Staphylococcus pettenkoferi]MCY1571207.1 hypothetical protein [Staphylococcus pettenkoferi]MCY1583620.1 hypothetical protein [Staphylococcus pettenkoferi]MCY1589368.1 hypothetical protein [Staphylococcus pettenkoferi]MCY1592899.1 hypothetical protein [Staphylococcus pettenkoferi]